MAKRYKEKKAQREAQQFRKFILNAQKKGGVFKWESNTYIFGRRGQRENKFIKYYQWRDRSINELFIDIQYSRFAIIIIIFVVSGGIGILLLQ